MRNWMTRSGAAFSRIGYGAFKIGRNQNVKYPQGYDLPDEAASERLLNSLLDLGITYFDTAPAYGWSEARLGRHLSRRREEFLLSTKVGERFEAGVSTYDFSRAGMIQSVEQSLKDLKTEQVDLLFLHTPSDDLSILMETDAVSTLQDIKSRGWTRAIGLSGKTVAAARVALDWADALMVEYHLEDQSHQQVMAEAGERGLAVIVKKGLGSGHLPPETSIPFVLKEPAVSSLIIGGLNLEHFRANLELDCRL